MRDARASVPSSVRLLLLLCALVLGATAGCGDVDGDRNTARPEPASSPGARAPAPGRAARSSPARKAERARAPSIRSAPAERRDRLSFQAPDALARARLGTPVTAGVAFDLDSGRVLWRRSARRALPIASLTKVMTALLVVGATRPRDVVTVPAAAWTVRGSRMGDLRPGRRVRVEALLHGLLMSSGNDSAVALAVHVAGSERAFVRRMNARARRMELTCTRFYTPHGLGSGRTYGRGARTVACPAVVVLLRAGDPRAATERLLAAAARR